VDQEPRATDVNANSTAGRSAVDHRARPLDAIPDSSCRARGTGLDARRATWPCGP
jgi:hypothetical protein